MYSFQSLRLPRWNACILFLNNLPVSGEDTTPSRSPPAVVVTPSTFPAAPSHEHSVHLTSGSAARGHVTVLPLHLKPGTRTHNTHVWQRYIKADHNYYCADGYYCADEYRFNAFLFSFMIRSQRLEWAMYSFANWHNCHGRNHWCKCHRLPPPNHSSRRWELLCR